MPPSDPQIALLLQSQYDETPRIFDHQAVTNEVSWAVKHFDDCDVMAFEGSHNLPDWERDFQANMIHVEGLGGVHAGFYSGLPETFAAASPFFSMDKPLLVIGHSLGGRRNVPFSPDFWQKLGIRKSRRSPSEAPLLVTKSWHN